MISSCCLQNTQSSLAATHHRINYLNILACLDIINWYTATTTTNLPALGNQFSRPGWFRMIHVLLWLFFTELLVCENSIAWSLRLCLHWSFLVTIPGKTLSKLQADDCVVEITFNYPLFVFLVFLHFIGNIYQLGVGLLPCLATLLSVALVLLR